MSSMMRSKTAIRHLRSHFPSLSVPAFSTHRSPFSTQRTAAVVLSGCGVYDGAEIQESVAALTHLSRAGCAIQCYAPDKPQFHVVDHTKGEEMEPERNCMVEASRISRGDIKPLSDLKASNHDVLVIPGGFGAAKNLCNHATVAQGDLSKLEIDPELERAMKEFSHEKKAIGLCCIAPVIAAAVLKCDVTIGMESDVDGKWPYSGTAEAVKNYGGKHVETDLSGVVTDHAARVVTSPAYMCNGEPHEIYDSVGNMVEAVLKLN